MAVEKLEAGVEFDRLGSWFNTIDRVLAVEHHIALVEGHEEDGFTKWWIFIETNNGWQSSYSSTQKDAMEDQFLMMVNNRR